MSAATQLAEGLARLQLDLAPDVQQKLLDYLALVHKWNKVYNLTAVRDAGEMLTHHLLDSLAVVPHVAGAKTLLDVGSGAGLPGIPLALALPGMQVTLLDSNQKKAAFLRQAVIELNLVNVSVVCDRVEKLVQNQLFSVVISRAFADLAKFVTLAGHLLEAGGMLLAMKGVAAEDEITRIPAGFTLSSRAQLTVPGLDAKRTLLFLKAA